MGMNYTPLPHEFLDELDCLSDEEYGRLVRAMQGYFMDGQEPELPGQERLFWKRCRNTMDRYAESYTTRYSASSGNGKKGGRPRKNSPKENQSGFSENLNNLTGFSENLNNPAGFSETQQKPTVSEKSQKSQTESKTKTESKTNIPPVSPPKGAGFEEFWALYPRKVGKQAAWKTWSRLKPDAELTKAILSAVEYQCSCPQWQRENGRYIPNPETWLNQGRWEDKFPGGIPKGATGQLGEAELEAIRAVLEDE